jgi:prepilin-type N-terminal cleavage/methylation domain-containing protein
MLNQRGYSILEMMMVVCVIGVLSMVAMTEYNKVHNRAYVGAAMNDVQLLRKALSMYDAEWGAFPHAAAGNCQQLAGMLVSPNGDLYIDPPSGGNFDAFNYAPPAAGDEYGDYALTVVCKDHWKTQITVHQEQNIETVRLAN